MTIDFNQSSDQKIRRCIDFRSVKLTEIINRRPNALVKVRNDRLSCFQCEAKLNKNTIFFKKKSNFFHSTEN
jgi:hypothetical protein